MIPKEKELKLINIYICDVYESSLRFYYQRFSNNSNPIFTDQELLTAYLFSEPISDTSVSKRYIRSLRNICFHGFLNCLLIRLSRQNLLGLSILGRKQKNQGACMLTPVKAIKGEEPVITQKEKAGRDLFSTAVSKIRQPIESLFNWINEKTNIQRAMKVRSTPRFLIQQNQKATTDAHYL